MAKSIFSPVGQGGSNGSQDAMTIPYLLNCVPPNRGGPTGALVVAGVIGPKTIAAIKAFQKANSLLTDGRVDPGRQTLQALQSFDPNPGAPIGLAMQKQSWKQGHKDFGSKGYKEFGSKGYKDFGYKDAGYKTGYKEFGSKGYKDFGYKDSGFKTGYKNPFGYKG